MHLLKFCKIMMLILLFIGNVGNGFASCVKKSYLDNPLYPHLCPLKPSLREGYYVGLGLGYDQYLARVSFPTTAVNISGNLYQNPAGAGVGLLLGYGQYLGDLIYFGAEVSAFHSGITTFFSIRSPSGEISNDLQAKESFAITFRPGIRLNCTTRIYLRIGCDWQTLEENGRLIINNIDPPIFTDDDKRLKGRALGLGLETLLIKNWSLRIDATHVNRQSRTTKMRFRVQPADNRIMLSFIYHFPRYGLIIPDTCNT